MKSLSRVRLFATPWTVAYQAALSMGFSRQDYWNGLPFLSPGDLLNPGIEPQSPTLQADALTSAPPVASLVKHLPAMGDTGGLQSTGRKESDTTERLHFHFATNCDPTYTDFFFSLINVNIFLHFIY